MTHSPLALPDKANPLFNLFKNKQSFPPYSYNLIGMFRGLITGERMPTCKRITQTRGSGTFLHLLFKIRFYCNSSNKKKFQSAPVPGDSKWSGSKDFKLFQRGQGWKIGWWIRNWSFNTWFLFEFSGKEISHQKEKKNKEINWGSSKMKTSSENHLCAFLVTPQDVKSHGPQHWPPHGYWFLSYKPVDFLTQNASLKVPGRAVSIQSLSPLSLPFLFSL